MTLTSRSTSLSLPVQKSPYIKVLVIDEIDYLLLDNIGGTIFFQLVSARYERANIILTSNKSYGD
jgi:DNA replication protein DnaC